MGIAQSSRFPPKDDGLWDAERVAARQRSFEWSEFLDAYFMYKCSGGGMESARPVFRAALARCADYGQVYCAWANMEMDAEPSAARALFEEWRARSAADGGLKDDGRAAFLWTNYVLFEVEHGGAARARAVADAAVAACPRNAEVRAECVLAEVRLGDDARARAAFHRALADFADDEEAARLFVTEVRRGGEYLSETKFGGCLNFCRGWWFRPPRWWEQI